MRPTPHFIFLISCSLWRLKWDSAQKSESLEAVPGDPGRCVSWLKHTAWTGEGSFHSEFLPSRELPTGMNSDLQLIGTEEESSSNAIQPFTPSSPPDASSTAWISWGTGVKDGGSRLTAGPCSSLVSDFDYLIGNKRKY